MIEASTPEPFGEWLPDAGEFANPGSLVALNVITEGPLYKPFSESFPYTEPLPNECKGAFSVRDAMGNVTVFAGTRYGLFKLNGLAWEEVTRGVGTSVVPYTMSDEDFWVFVNFGSLIIATNYVDDIQVFDMDSSTEFEQLSPTAPRCRHFFILKRFLICLDTVDSDGDVGYRVRWSPFNDPQGDWTDDPTGTQADFQDLIGGGYSNTFGAEILDFGVIVQGGRLWRMDYVGGDDIFAFTPLDVGRGSILTRSCIANGRSVFLLGEDGFYEYNGNFLDPIGDGKVDKTFYEMFDETYDYNLNVTIDPLKKNILWAFPSRGTVGYTDKILCFNWVTRRFTLIEENSQLLFNYFSSGYNVDNVDGLFTSIELPPYSVDSRFWTGGKTLLGTFNTDGRLSTFSSAPKTAILGTTEVRLNPSGRSVVHSVIPYINGATCSARLGTRNRIKDASSYTAVAPENSLTGEIDFLHDAVFHRAEVTITGAWDVATAIAYRSQPSAGQ